MPSNRKRIISYVSEKKHKELKMFCYSLGISISRFIDEAIQEKADRELKKKEKND